MAEETEKKPKVKRPTPVKRIIQSEKRRLSNQAFKSRVKTAWRQFDESLVKGEQDSMKAALNLVYGLMDKGAKRGLFKQNKADRLKSRASARVASKTA